MDVVLFSINIGVDLYTRSTYTQDNTVVSVKIVFSTFFQPRKSNEKNFR